MTHNDRDEIIRQLEEALERERQKDEALRLIWRGQAVEMWLSVRDDLPEPRRYTDKADLMQQVARLALERTQ